MPPTLYAGAARQEITPAPGSDLAGYIARQNPSTGVRDPLFVRALVLDDDRRQLALVSCDLLGFDQEFVDDVRARIQLATGIPGPQVMLAATHTHAGPAVFFLQDCGEPDPRWLEQCQARIAATVVQAQTALAPATLAVGQAETTAGVHNRRQPGAVIDPAVGVLQVTDESGAPLAVVVNYACHPTSLYAENRLISADYPGLVTATIEAATSAVCLFLTGAIGDVGPVERGETSLKRVGGAVAAAAQQTLSALTPIVAPTLDTEGEILALPLNSPPTWDQLAGLREAYQRQALAADAAGDSLQARIARAMTGWSERVFDLYRERRLPATVAAEVQTLHLGELVIVGVPGELFVELGLQIKAGAAGRSIFVCGFANDSIGYIPTRAAYPRGGYEIDEAYKYYGYPAALAPEAGEQLVTSVLEKIGGGV
jgi:hypothetical protein